MSHPSSYRIQWVDGKRHREHRLVLAEVYGWEALEGMDVHHLNGDKLDNRLENLVIVSPADHIRLYHPFPNQWPDSHWEGVAEVYRDGGRKPVVAITEHYGVPYSTAFKWVYRARLKGFLPPGRSTRKAAGLMGMAPLQADEKTADSVRR